MSIRSVKNIQKIIKIPEGYTSSERQAIAAEIIDYIKKTTKDGVSPITGRNYKGYSKKYKESLDFKNAKDGTVDLRLSGDMVASLEMLDESFGKIKIGYEESDVNAGKAEGNQIGSYGMKSGTTGKARPFIGISSTALKEILKKYPLDNEAQRLEQTQRVTLVSNATDITSEGLGGLFDFELPETE